MAQVALESHESERMLNAAALVSSSRAKPDCMSSPRAR